MPPESPEQSDQKPRAWFTFGRASHEQEYVISVEVKRDSRGFLPAEIAHSLEKELGEEWEVKDRGTRIEIYHKKKHGFRDDATVSQALQAVLGNEYNIQEG